MALIPMYLRVEAPDGIEEYRILDGHIEVRQLQHPIEEDRVWYRLTADELVAHINRNTVVAQWLERRLGWRRLLQACVGEQNLFYTESADNTVERRAA